ncbi:MAG: LysR substrate-binding domain-containing protein, partial [Vicinamibacterales bacterium]
VLGELQGRRIGGDDLVLVAPGASPLAKRHPVKPSDLRDEAWVVREDDSNTRHQMERWFRRQRLMPAHLVTLHGSDAVKRAVIAGLGISLVSRVVVADELESGRLVALPVSTPVPTRDVLLVDHPQKHHGAACRAMLELLTGAIESSAASSGPAMSKLVRSRATR